MSQPLTNTNINSFLDHIDGFVGTFPSDIVPIQKKDEPQAFVINTAPDGSSGEHWTALILTKQKCLYFDSFGEQMNNIILLNSLKRIGVKNYQYNNSVIQPTWSNSCGYYCIAFILAFVCDNSYTSFLSNFVTNIDENDNRCYRFIQKHINKHC